MSSQRKVSHKIISFTKQPYHQQKREVQTNVICANHRCNHRNCRRDSELSNKYSRMKDLNSNANTVWKLLGKYQSHNVNTEWKMGNLE